jgi:hypothetical protein
MWRFQIGVPSTRLAAMTAADCAEYFDQFQIAVCVVYEELDDEMRAKYDQAKAQFLEDCAAAWLEPPARKAG